MIPQPALFFMHAYRKDTVFRLEDRGLVSYHHSPEGDLVQTFGADSSNALTTLVAPFVSRVDHAMYLGREIDRIVSAREGGRDYEQDKIQ